MRGCCYFSKPENKLWNCLALLPRLALPIGPGPFSAVPSSETTTDYFDKHVHPCRGFAYNVGSQASNDAQKGASLTNVLEGTLDPVQSNYLDSHAQTSTVRSDCFATCEDRESHLLTTSPHQAQHSEVPMICQASLKCARSTEPSGSNGSHFISENAQDLGQRGGVNPPSQEDRILQSCSETEYAGQDDVLTADNAESDTLDRIIQDIDPQQAETIEQSLDELRFELIKMSQTCQASVVDSLPPALESSADPSTAVSECNAATALSDYRTEQIPSQPEGERHLLYCAPHQQQCAEMSVVSPILNAVAMPARSTEPPGSNEHCFLSESTHSNGLRGVVYLPHPGDEILQPPSETKDGTQHDVSMVDNAEDDLLEGIAQELDPQQVEAIKQNLDVLRFNLVKMSQACQASTVDSLPLAHVLSADPSTVVPEGDAAPAMSDYRTEQILSDREPRLVSSAPHQQECTELPIAHSSPNAGVMLARSTEPFGSDGHCSRLDNAPFIGQQGVVYPPHPGDEILQPSSTTKDGGPIDALMVDNAEDDILDGITQGLDPQQVEAVKQNLDMLRVDLMKMSQDCQTQRSESLAHDQPAKQTPALSGDMQIAAAEIPEQRAVFQSHSLSRKKTHHQRLMTVKGAGTYPQTDHLVSEPHQERNVAATITQSQKVTTSASISSTTSSVGQMNERGRKRAASDIVDNLESTYLGSPQEILSASVPKKLNLATIPQAQESGTVEESRSDNSSSPTKGDPSLTPLDRFAKVMFQVVSKGGSLEVACVPVYRDFQSRDESFVAMMASIANCFGKPKDKLRQGEFIRKCDFLLPIIKRIKYWSLLALLPENKRFEMQSFGIKKNIKRATLLDTVDAASLYHQYQATEEGGALRKRILDLGSSAKREPRMDEILHGIKKYILGFLPTESELPQDMEASLYSLFLCALIYSIVCENLEFDHSDYWGNSIMTENVAKRISGQVIRCLQEQDTLLMNEEDRRVLKEESKWISAYTSTAPSVEALIARENPAEASVYETQFHLERVTRLFESITSLSTRSRKGPNFCGTWFPHIVREVIYKSSDEEVQAWRQSMMEMKDLLAKFDSTKALVRTNASAFKRHIYTIMRRYQAWLEAFDPKFEPYSDFQILNTSRRKVRDFVDALGLMKHIYTFKELLPDFESLLSRVPRVFEIWTIMFFPHEREVKKVIQEKLHFRPHQEMLMLSLVYSILAANLHYRPREYHDYTVLSKNDIKVLCDQAGEFLTGLEDPKATAKTSLKLPLGALLEIRKRLRPPA